MPKFSGLLLSFAHNLKAGYASIPPRNQCVLSLAKSSYWRHSSAITPSASRPQRSGGVGALDICASAQRGLHSKFLLSSDEI